MATGIVVTVVVFCRFATQILSCKLCSAPVELSRAGPGRVFCPNAMARHIIRLLLRSLHYYFIYLYTVNSRINSYLQKVLCREIKETPFRFFFVFFFALFGRA